VRALPRRVSGIERALPRIVEDVVVAADAPSRDRHRPEASRRAAEAIDGYGDTFPVACVLRLAPLLFVRPDELRKADIDGRSFVAKLWLIASVADAVSLSRIGEMRCGDSGLRQWAVCVTLPASPKTVTHA
jgi:hypothetical protein